MTIRLHASRAPRLPPDCPNDYRADYRQSPHTQNGQHTQQNLLHNPIHVAAVRSGATRRDTMKIVYFLVSAVAVCMIANLVLIYSTL